MSPPRTPQRTFSPERRFRIQLNVLGSILALLVIVALVNYLSARHYRRYQWAADERYALSAETRRVLEAITNEVRVTILFDRNHELFGPVSGLLREYAYACPSLAVEHLDYNRDPGRAELLTARYSLPGEADDLVVFDAGGRVKVVRSTELSDYDVAALLAGAEEVRRVTFKGEPLFTSALAGLLQERQPVACFLTGHGEHDPASDENKMGYSRFAKLLQNKNIEVRKIALRGDSVVPDDCSLLIVAGPQARLDDTEVQKIERYLAEGGRMLALPSFYLAQRSETGLERLLRNWGLVVGEDYVFDPPNTARGNDLICTNFPAHPITKPLQGRSIYLVVARSITPLPIPGASGDAPRVQLLAATGKDGYTASGLSSSGVPRPDPARDRRGVVPIAAAVERGSIAGVTADRFSTRLVVVGESIFLGNETIVKASNWEFAGLAVNWLLDRPEHLAGIAPRPIQEYAIELSRSQLNRLIWLLLVVLPGAVLALGLVVWFRRRA
ncbi:MAG: Gldg family protein [Verrucomicrobiales bacterium]|nr:Gldg family protein [Verrucomicrobiales bacterium]